MTQNTLFGFLFSWRKISLVDQLAGEIARECRADVAGRVERGSENMSLALLRGYVRAHAAQYIENEAAAVMLRQHLKPTTAARITQAAIEQIVVLVVRDVLNGETSSDRGTIAA